VLSSPVNTEEEKAPVQNVRAFGIFPDSPFGSKLIERNITQTLCKEKFLNY
jgi:hypothetical protein